MKWGLKNKQGGPMCWNLPSYCLWNKVNFIVRKKKMLIICLPLMEKILFYSHFQNNYKLIKLSSFNLFTNICQHDQQMIPIIDGKNSGQL